MNRCLRERTLLEIVFGDGTAAQHAHLRLCADCAERYDALSDDIETMSSTLARTAPPVRVKIDVSRVLMRWVPLGAVAAVLLIAGATVNLLRAPVPAPLALSSSNVPAFAADVSAALFASGDDAGSASVDDAPYLQAALEAGLPCTQERFFDGECEDQVFALVME